MSNFYNVTLVHDQFTITTMVVADDKESAIRMADQFLQDQGLPSWIADDSLSVQVELEGVFA